MTGKIKQKPYTFGNVGTLPTDESNKSNNCLPKPFHTRWPSVWELRRRSESEISLQQEIQIKMVMLLRIMSDGMTVSDMFESLAVDYRGREIALAFAVIDAVMALNTSHTMEWDYDKLKIKKERIDGAESRSFQSISGATV